MLSNPIMFNCCCCDSLSIPVVWGAPCGRRVSCWFLMLLTRRLLLLLLVESPPSGAAVALPAARLAERISAPWLHATIEARSSVAMRSDCVLEPNNEIVVTARSRSVASALVDCGEMSESWCVLSTVNPSPENQNFFESETSITPK